MANPVCLAYFFTFNRSTSNILVCVFTNDAVPNRSSLPNVVIGLEPEAVEPRLLCNAVRRSEPVVGRELEGRAKPVTVHEEQD
jgi:hypothetical protein